MSNPSGSYKFQMPVTEEDLTTGRIMVEMSMGQHGNTHVNSNDRSRNNTGRRSIPSSLRYANQDLRYDHQDTRHATLDVRHFNNDIKTQPYAPQTITTTANTNPYPQSHTISTYQPMNTNPSYKPTHTNQYQPVNITNTNPPQAASVYCSQACSNCWGYGHSIRRCPQLPCIHCGIMGHFNAHCPTKEEERKEAAKISRRKYRVKKHGGY